MLYTIRGLHDTARGVDIRVRVINVSNIRTVTTKNGVQHSVVDVMVGDRTGIISLSLWDEQTTLISEGDLIDITNGYVNKFKGWLKLNIGKYGRLEKVQDDSFPQRDDFRMNNIKW
jgi:replication factor A1